MDLARIAAALLLLLPAPLALADIYAFVDENGVRHISNVPTDARYKLVMSTPRYGGSASAAATAMGSVTSPTPRFTQNLNLGSGWRLITPRGRDGLKSAGSIGINWSNPQGKAPFRVNEANRSRFAATIEAIALQHRLDPALLHAVISAESAYDPKAVSRAGAMGLMQLMPATASRFGVADPFDPTSNIQGGATYLRLLLDQFRSVNLALAAYNAGEGAVSRYGNTIPPFAETQVYVKRVIGFYNHYRGTN